MPSLQRMQMLITFLSISYLSALQSTSESESIFTDSINNSTIVSTAIIEVYEIMSMLSLCLMLFVLFLAFCWGCKQEQMYTTCFNNSNDMFAEFNALCNNCMGGIYRDTNALLIQNTISLVKSTGGSTELQDITNTNVRIAKSSPIIATKLLLKSLDVYYDEFGNTDVPKKWKVPMNSPFPKETWGLDLGGMVWGLGNALSDSQQIIPEQSHNINISSIDSNSEHSIPLYGNSNSNDLTTQENHHDSHEHRSETWYELFYDLVFVASALQLGLIIKYDHRALGLIKAAILFYMLRSTWDHLTAYQNRFHTSDLMHMAFYVLQSMGAFVIALHLQIKDSVHSENEHSWDRAAHQGPIAMMASLVRFLTVLMYIKEAVRSSTDRPYIFRVLVHTSLSTVIFSASTFCSVTDDRRLYLWMWLLGILVERPLMLFLAYIQKDSPQMISGAHISHLIHRQGTFFMLILGEAVIQLVQAHGGYDVFAYVRALLGFAVVFNVGCVYYEQQQREAHKHVLRRSRGLGYLWVELQSSLSLCVLFFAVGVKLVFHGFDEVQEFRDEALMCFFAAISLSMMYVMALLHRGVEYNLSYEEGRIWHNLFRFVMAGLCAVIPFVSSSSTATVLILHIITTCLVVQDIMIRISRFEVLTNWMDLSQHTKSMAWVSVMDSSTTSFANNYNNTTIIKKKEKKIKKVSKSKQKPKLDNPTSETDDVELLSSKSNEVA